MALRRVRAAATLCPDCQERVGPRNLQPDLYGFGRRSTAHLYAVPVLAALDAIRNCAHCRRHTDEDCPSWRKAHKSVAVLQDESRRSVRGIEELHHATGGQTAAIYEFADGSVAYFAPDAPDLAEAGELKDDALGRAIEILQERGVVRAAR